MTQNQFKDPRESDEISLMERVYINAVEEPQEDDGAYADDDPNDHILAIDEE